MDADPGLAGMATPPHLLRRFSAAEGSIYPLAVTDPDRYERAVTVVGVLLRYLREECPDVGSLVDRLPELPGQAGQLARAHGVSLTQLAPDAVADAAAALRYRELTTRS